MFVCRALCALCGCIGSSDMHAGCPPARRGQPLVSASACGADRRRRSRLPAECTPGADASPLRARRQRRRRHLDEQRGAARSAFRGNGPFRLCARTFLPRTFTHTRMQVTAASAELEKRRNALASMDLVKQTILYSGHKCPTDTCVQLSGITHRPSSPSPPPPPLAPRTASHVHG